MRALGKKALILNYLVLFGLVITLAIAFTLTAGKLSFNHKVGDPANRILDLHSTLEQEAAVRSAEAWVALGNITPAFYASGGFVTPSSCGTVDGSQAYLHKGTLCFPDLPGNFSASATEALDAYLKEPYRAAVVNRSDTFVVYGMLPNVSVLNDSPAKLNLDNASQAYILSDNRNVRVPVTVEAGTFSDIEAFVRSIRDCQDIDCVKKALAAFNAAQATRISDQCDAQAASAAAAFYASYQACQDSLDADCRCNLTALPGSPQVILQNRTINVSGTVYATYVNTSQTYDGKAFVSGDRLQLAFSASPVLSVDTLSAGKWTSQKQLLSYPLQAYKGYDDRLGILTAPSSAPYCALPQYPEIELCAESHESYLYFDPAKGTFVDTTLPIDFGIRLQGAPPEVKVAILSAKDKPDEENAALITFRPLTADGIYEYNIYTSAHAFTDTKDAALATTLFIRDRSDQTITLDLPDGVTSYVAIAPMNLAGQENTEVDSVPVTPIDDVAPGPVSGLSTDASGTSVSGNEMRIASKDGSFTLSWKAPDINGNGEPLTDLAGYFLFTGTSPIATLPKYTKEQCIQAPGCIFSDKTSYAFSGMPKDVYVKVVAIDEVPNYDGSAAPIPLPSTTLSWPVQGPLSSCYGWRDLSGKKDWHQGIDIAVPAGTPVKAASSGIVYSTCINPKNTMNHHASQVCSGFGTNIVLYHPQLNVYTRYDHLSQLSVAKGQYVRQGDVIGLSGNTGYSAGPHLDFKYCAKPSCTDTPGVYTENPLCYLPTAGLQFTADAASCKDSDGTATSSCPVGS